MAPLCIPWEELFFGGGESEAGERCTRAPCFATAPVFVANDWHAALVPLFLTAKYQARSEQILCARESSPTGATVAIARATCVLIVHNLAHSGCFPSSRYKVLGLSEENAEWYPALRWRWHDGGESMNFLKAGLVTASAVVLVSPSYCEVGRRFEWTHFPQLHDPSLSDNIFRAH
jgi:starch synthase